jgi:hypothetical protein
MGIEGPAVTVVAGRAVGGTEDEVDWGIMVENG